MEHLLELAEEARRQVSLPEVHFHGGLLLRAIDDFAASLAERYHLPNRGSTRDVLEALVAPPDETLILPSGR